MASYHYGPPPCLPSLLLLRLVLLVHTFLATLASLHPT